MELSKYADMNREVARSNRIKQATVNLVALFEGFGTPINPNQLQFVDEVKAGTYDDAAVLGLSQEGVLVHRTVYGEHVFILLPAPNTAPDAIMQDND